MTVQEESSSPILRESSPTRRKCSPKQRDSYGSFSSKKENSNSPTRKMSYDSQTQRCSKSNLSSRESLIQNVRKSLAKLLPEGTCLLQEIMDSDPIPKPIQMLMLSLTMLLTALIPLAPVLFRMSSLGGFGSTVDSDATIPERILQTLEIRFELDRSVIGLIAVASTIPFALLVFMDAIYKHSWPGENVYWIKASECYRMMFMEPQRKNRLIAAPGNTLSNWSFFFTSSLLFARLQRDDPFFVPDLMGASVGMILAIASTLWHSTNSAAVHYVDLCFMYAVMLFIPCSILAHTYPSEITVPILVAVEVLIVVTLMIHYKGLYERKEYHDVFTLAFRQELLKKGDKAPHMIKMCLFFGIPVLEKVYLLFGVQHCDEIFHYIGSIAFAFAWIYRSGERWALDGHPVLKVVKYSPYQSFFFGLLSPTAIMHWFCGLTMLVSCRNCQPVSI